MSDTLENAWLQLTINAQSSTWSVESRQFSGSIFRNVQMGVIYRSGLAVRKSLIQWKPFMIESSDVVDSFHGSLRQKIIHVGPDRNNLEFTITFVMPDADPLLMWKIQVVNKSRREVYIKKIEMLRLGFSTISSQASGSSLGRSRGSFQLYPKSGEFAFFSNGWGSWNHTGVYGVFDKFRRTRLGPLTTPMRVNEGTPQPRGRGHFASDMFGVIGDRKRRIGVVVGFLSQREHFGSIEFLADPMSPALGMWANGDGALLLPGERMVTDWACMHFLHIDTPDPLSPYLDAVAREHNLSQSDLATNAIPTGWCSWYQYSWDISTETIRRNLLSAGDLQPEIPLRLIQIDDGYQSQIGDWLDIRDAFPHGLASLASEIKDAGFMPGLWLAPFIVHPQSQLAANHPNWLLRNRWGASVKAGYKNGALINVLDLTHPDALDYIREIIRTAVAKWGYSYLKLDYLYAGALAGYHHDLTLTRAQVIRKGLQAIREIAGEETTMLACGCPIGSAIGLFDGMRVGADVASTWHPKQLGTHFFFRNEPDLPAVRNATQNILTRVFFHNRWWINDPDCLLLGSDNGLTLAEVQTLATVIVLSGGSLILSDDLSNLSGERLRIAQSLFPLIGKVPFVMDWMDSSTPSHLQLDLDGPVGAWHVLALFNWNDKFRDLTLKPGDFFLDSQHSYFARSFWQGKTYHIPEDGNLTLPNVPPHGCELLALRSCLSIPQYLGSDFHISQGAEVTSWEIAKDEVSFTLERPGDAVGHIELHLPASPKSATITPLTSVSPQERNQAEAIPLGWQSFNYNVFRTFIRFHGKARLRVHLG